MTNGTKCLFLALPLFLAACDPGGGIVDRAESIWEQDSIKRLDGVHMSAATMELSKGCVTQGARFMFHPPQNTTPENHAQAVHFIGAFYPQPLRKWWLDQGHSQTTWMTARQVIELGAMECKK